MNILFIHSSYQLFNNLDCGAAVRNTMLVKALSMTGHVDVISFFEEPVESNINNCDVVFSEQVKSSPSVLEKVLKNIRLFFTPWKPYGYFQLNKLRAGIIDRELQKKNYDIIACRYIGTAISCGLLKYPNKLVVDVDDNPVNACKSNLRVGNYPNTWNKLKLVWQIAFIGGMTERLVKQIRCSFFSNILEPPSEKSIFLHNLPMVSRTLLDIEKTTPQRILTVGNLDYPPNKHGVRHFVESIFPIIRERLKGVEFYVVGKTKDNSFLDYLNSLDGVKALGYVEDIFSEYERCRVVVIPVYHGSGTCVKFAEGLMTNRPMVSTIQGVRGFEHLCEDGDHYLLAKDDKEFADKITCLLTSEDLSRKIAKKAYETGLEYFSQDRFYEIVSNSIV